MNAKSLPTTRERKFGISFTFSHRYANTGTANQPDKQTHGWTEKRTDTQTTGRDGETDQHT